MAMSSKVDFSLVRPVAEVPKRPVAAAGTLQAPVSEPEINTEENMVGRKWLTAVGIGSMAFLALLGGTVIAKDARAVELLGKDAAATELVAKEAGAQLTAKDAAFAPLAAKDAGASELYAKDAGALQLLSKDAGAFELVAKDAGAFALTAKEAGSTY
jgi:hypothetical protein